jgi:single-stranded DNA-binding protein
MMNVKVRKVRGKTAGKGVDWHKVVAYGRVGQACYDNLKKGMKVFLIGNLESRHWKDKTGGQWRHRVQIAVRSVTLDMHQWSSDFLDLALILAAQDSDREPGEDVDS